MEVNIAQDTMKRVWGKVTKGHLSLFLFLLAAVIVLSYAPSSYVTRQTGYSTVGPYGCVSGEYLISQVSSSKQIQTSSGIQSCCPRPADCVLAVKGVPTCFKSGGADGDADSRIDSYCFDSTWTDCDVSSDSCTSTLRCSPSYRWIQRGEEGVGQYQGSTQIACCGDDSGEYVIEGLRTGKTWPDIESICCNAPDDTFADGKCASPPIGNKELCDNGKDDDGDGVVDGLDADCRGKTISVSSVRVSEDTLDTDEDFSVTCEFEEDISFSRSEIESCLSVEVNSGVCDNIDDIDNSEVTFECNSGEEEGEIAVECIIDSHCNTDSRREERSIDVGDFGGCTDNDRDGSCLGLDCNDLDSQINPLAGELCGDRKDNDCNQFVDENCCGDGIQNGDEEDTDCGGNYCPSCETDDTEEEVPATNDDWDNDGLSNREEFGLGTNPYESDTDSDGIPDGEDDNPLRSGEKTSSLILVILIIFIILVLLGGAYFGIKRLNTKKERHINNPRLISYIRQARDVGMSDQEITSALLQRGWDKKSITSGLQSLESKKG